MTPKVKPVQRCGRSYNVAEPCKNVALKKLAYGHAPNLQLKTGDKHSETLKGAAVAENNYPVKCLISVFMSLPSIRLISRPLCVIAK